MELISQVPYPAQMMNFALPVAGARPRWSVIVKATFKLRASGVVTPVANQPPLTIADVPSAPGDTALMPARYESDFVPFKPRADCLCVGTAYPPDGGATSCVVSFGVGTYFDKEILVVGDRQIVRLDPERLGATKPATFTSMPLTFANAYGGQDPALPDAAVVFADNPVGKGYAVSSDSAIGRPLPNLENPQRRLRDWHDRVAPRTFGPVGRTWQPRLGRAGTFDGEWLRQRAPQVPIDFSESYYNAAPSDQQVQGYLRGDEELRLTNLHPRASRISCRLPGVRIRAIVASAARSAGQANRISLRDVPVNLDTLWVDADALRVVLVWRARFHAALGETRLLLVREHVDDQVSPPESYRGVLEQLDADAAEELRREAELGREDPVDDAIDDSDADADDIPELSLL